MSSLRIFLLFSLLWLVACQSETLQPLQPRAVGTSAVHVTRLKENTPPLPGSLDVIIRRPQQFRTLYPQPPAIEADIAEYRVALTTNLIDPWNHLVNGSEQVFSSGLREEDVVLRVRYQNLPGIDQQVYALVQAYDRVSGDPARQNITHRFSLPIYPGAQGADPNNPSLFTARSRNSVNPLTLYVSSVHAATLEVSLDLRSGVAENKAFEIQPGGREPALGLNGAGDGLLVFTRDAGNNRRLFAQCVRGFVPLLQVEPIDLGDYLSNGNPLNPRVRTNESGQSFVVWQQGAAPNVAAPIYGQHLDARGCKVVGERVDLSPNAQDQGAEPDVDLDAHGDGTVVWSKRLDYNAVQTPLEAIKLKAFVPQIPPIEPIVNAEMGRVSRPIVRVNSQGSGLVAYRVTMGSEMGPGRIYWLQLVNWTALQADGFFHIPNVDLNAFSPGLFVNQSGNGLLSWISTPQNSNGSYFSPSNLHVLRGAEIREFQPYSIEFGVSQPVDQTGEDFSVPDQGELINYAFKPYPMGLNQPRMPVWASEMPERTGMLGIINCTNFIPRNLFQGLPAACDQARAGYLTLNYSTLTSDQFNAQNPRQRFSLIGWGPLDPLNNPPEIRYVSDPLPPDNFKSPPQIAVNAAGTGLMVYEICPDACFIMGHQIQEFKEQ